MKIEEYILEDGSSPYKNWFDSLDATAAAKVTAAKVRLEQGNTSSVKWFEGIGEYKIDFGPGYRIYLAQDGDQLIVLFGGGTKKRQNADIAEAKRLNQAYKGRKAKLSQTGCRKGCREEHQTNEEEQEVMDMALTRDYKETIVERVNRDPDFAKALLDEAGTLFLNGEPETARLILRDLVNATTGFEPLALAMSKPSKSLHRMLSERGNPSMDNIAAIFSAVSKKLNVQIETKVVTKKRSMAKA